jgi:hypothetical protein
VPVIRRLHRPDPQHRHTLHVAPPAQAHDPHRLHRPLPPEHSEEQDTEQRGDDHHVEDLTAGLGHVPAFPLAASSAQIIFPQVRRSAPHRPPVTAATIASPRPHSS